MFRDLEKAQQVFVGLAAHVTFGANLSYRGQTINGEGMMVSGSYFPVLGLQPALGRLLTPEDDRTIGGHPVVVLSDAYWRARFDANPNVLNETLVVNGQAFTIVGVAPRDFFGTSLGSRPHVYVAAHDAGRAAARVRAPEVQWLREPPELFRLSVRAAQAGRFDRGGDDRHQHPVFRHRQRRRSRRCSGG